ncbi:MAG TPA: ABC transporter ATP-binding protein [Planctomycetota bacterium]|nr:ABC transporter ATP-binding protein [Planctomycetota bacterium]
MTATESSIRVEGLSKTYSKRLFKKGFRALDDVSIEVGRGSVFGLLGPNGAGKTTLIKILLGLVRGFEGEAWLFGDRAGSVASRRRVGYLPEAHRLPTYLTGRQVMELFGQMCGRDVQFLRARIPALLEKVGMSKDADRKMREYSKGMMQRIGLAQALIHEPELIFLDEPTDGVDPIGRAAIREIVMDLKARGVTIFINSHLLMEVELMCDRVVIMDHGRILRQGTIDELTPRTGIAEFTIAPPDADLERVLAGIGRDFARTERGFDISVSDSELDECVDRLRAAGISVKGILSRRLNLEQAFIGLVNKEGWK